MVIFKRAEFGTGFYIVSIVMIAIFILSAMSTTTSSILSGFSFDGPVGFLVNYWNVIILICLTLVGFVGLAVISE